MILEFIGFWPDVFIWRSESINLVDLLWLQEFEVQLAKSEDMQIIRDLVDSLQDRRSILGHLEQLNDGCEF